MYAIVDWRGRQYRVEAGQRISLDRLPAEEGVQLQLGTVLLLATEEGVQVGQPAVGDARVTARVVRHYRSRKGHGFKYKAKKRYSRRWGFRRDLTELLIERIEGAGQVSEWERTAPPQATEAEAETEAPPQATEAEAEAPPQATEAEAPPQATEAEGETEAAEERASEPRDDQEE